MVPISHKHSLNKSNVKKTWINSVVWNHVRDWNDAAKVVVVTYASCRCESVWIRRIILKTNSFAIFFSWNDWMCWLIFASPHTHTLNSVCNAVYEFSPSHELGFDSVSKSASSSSNSGSPLGSSNTFQKQLLPTRKKEKKLQFKVNLIYIYIFRKFNTNHLST